MVKGKWSEKYYSLQVAVYSIHLFLFFFVLVPWIGGGIRDKCQKQSRCARYIQESSMATAGFYTYRVDLADGQWREFRETLWLFATAICALAVVNFVLEGAAGMVNSVSRFGVVVNADGVSVEEKAQARKSFVASLVRAVSGVIILFIQHGFHSFIVITVCLLTYAVATKLKGSFIAPYAVWMIALALLFFKESYRVMNYPGMHFLVPFFHLENFYSGMYSWRFPANFLVLRIISFGVDLHSAALDARLFNERAKVGGLTSHDANPEDKKGAGNVSQQVGDRRIGMLDQRNKSVSSASDVGIASATTTAVASISDRTLEEHESFLHFAAYMFYAPLYVAGPIVTYSEFVKYSKEPQKSENWVVYGARWVGCFLAMEVMTSKFPFFAVISSGMLPRLHISEIAVVMYITLKMMWLKFLLIWRFFRLWALIDGINPPENMMRCMSNNYSLEQFWKGWHSSYNKWIVQYMYKPLGGRARRLLSVWVVFLFVAAWHDMEWKLLLWGLLNSGFFVTEIVVKRFLGPDAPHSPLRALPPAASWFVQIAAGASYVIVLVFVNLLGYAVGVGGISVVMKKIFSVDGAITLLVSCYFVFMAVVFMHFLRDIGVSKNL